MPKEKRTRKKKRCAAFVPYARGFHPPSQQRCLEAATTHRGEKLPQEYLDQDGGGEIFFPHIPQPSSIDDWLAQYNEEGQTYSQFLYECPWLSRRKRKYMPTKFNAEGPTLIKRYSDSKIYLLPLGEFDSQRGAPSFSELADYASVFFSLPVVVLPPVKLTIDHSRREVLWVDSAPLREQLSNP